MKSRRIAVLIITLLISLFGLISAAFAQGGEPFIGPMAGQTSCQLDIDDLNDNNPFTYTFSAINTNNIGGYEWQINGVVVSSAASFSQTFATTGTYNIQLTCIPSDGSANMILSGVVSVTSTPYAGFDVSPGLTGYAPFTVTTVNTSTAANPSYLWEVVAFPGGAGPFATSTAQNTGYTFTVPGTYTLRLTVTDQGGVSSAFQQDVAVNALPPDADFTISPVTGTAPLTVTVNGVDEGQGPITSWSWTFTGGTLISGDPATAGPLTIQYSAQGGYTVRLDYSGPGGSGWVQKSVNVAPSGGAVDASYTWTRMGNVAGGVRICFTNTSTGPIADNYWTFGDGTPGVVNNNGTVCHDYAADGNYSVRLTVSSIAGCLPSCPPAAATAQEEQIVNVVSAPVASFNASASTITWGQRVNFTDTSTGVIDTWAWDFNGDGVIDSTLENPTNIAIGNINGVQRLGANRVRLTVTGPGGSSFVEMIITVSQLQLTCDFSGSLFVTPGSGPQTYTSAVGQANGRTVSYEWRVNGAAVGTAQNLTNYTWTTEGTYTLSLHASTPDGANCSRTKTVTVDYPALNCVLSGNTAVLPNGTNHNYTATVTGAAGRDITYTWYEGATIVQGPTTLASGVNDVYTRSWTTETTTPIRYVATASDGSGCDDQITVTAEWSDLTCAINGSGTPRPTMPSDGGAYNNTYTATITGHDGRPLSYRWLVDGVEVSTTSTLTLNYTWPQEDDTHTIELQVTADNGGGVTAPCSNGPVTRDITVTIPALICNAPNGDDTPVVGETVSFTRSVTNRFGRPYATGSSATSTAWDFQRWNGTAWVSVDTDVPGDSYTFTFSTPSERYRVRYNVSVIDPVEDCNTESAWQVINVAGAGQDFTCDAWISGSISPANPATSYTYTIEIDNTNAINLRYTWALIAGDGTRRDLRVATWDGDGQLSETFTGSQFGPIGDYTLRVFVEPVNPADTTHRCDDVTAPTLSRALNVGTFSVAYTYTGDNNAIEVGQSICLTNTSTTSHDGIDGLDYTWDFGTALNSTGAQTSIAQQPGCFSFDAQGTYVLRLTGRNALGTRTNSYSVTFRVYNTQSILINRTDSHIYAGNTLNFESSGVNINTYTWNFYNASNVRVGPANRTGTSINQYFATPGTYRAEVVGSGPLGTTTASYSFDLLPAGQIRAAFTPSQYAGLATLNVCFADNSTGTNLRTWEWDFGNGQTLTYDHNNIPAQICTDYPNGDTDYPVTLRVTNQAGTSANASNVIRTYSQLESHSTFTITPVSGSRYCFTAVLASGVTVTGWQFGDGSTAGAVNTPCHTYSSASTYIVRMLIREGPDTGEIIRTVVVRPPGGSAASLSVTPACSAARTASFTVTNTGGAMATSDQVTIRDRNGAPVFIGVLNLGAGQSATFSVANMSGRVTFQTVDGSAAAANTDCEYPPAVRVQPICSPTIGFLIHNDDGPMISTQTYQVRNSAGTIVASGSFQLARGAAPHVVSIPNMNPYDRYTLTSSGDAGSFTMVRDCDQPALTVTATCSNPVIFTIHNEGGSMLGLQSIRVRDASGQAVTPSQSMIYLGANSTVTIDLSGYDPYGVYTIESDGFAGTFTFEQPCGQPALSVSVRCEAPVAFILRNDGAAMRAAQTFRVVDLTGADLTPNASSFMLDQGQTQQIIIPDVTDGGGLTLEVRSSAGVSAAVRMNCASLPQVTTPLPFTGFVVDGTGLPAWDGVPVCGRGCPDFQLYHSNETGDWEIFRLNGWDEAGRVTNRENLSLGEGVTDMAPSVSPNFEWVVFTSNRASTPGGPENWELYVAPTSGENPDHVQRLTFNQTAIDTDPVWGPNNWVVFETNRHGNWDLYAIDMSTGQEVRLTADAADDVNPYWSPDGQKIVFQSSRGGGFWQIWELDLRTLTARRLSDGSAIDVEPEYSPDGGQIAFRTYADGAVNSRIALMDADGGDRALISDAAGDATNQVWSPEGTLIAYQSDLDGDLDVYVYSAASGQTRQITDNDVDDYAPTWRCAGDQVIFTSDADASPDIYMADALPIEAESIRVEDDAEQMTFEPTDQIYPQGTPAEENASREGQTSQGVFGEQTAFLNPALDAVTIDLSIDGLAREDWPEVSGCESDREGIRDDEDEDAA